MNGEYFDLVTGEVVSTTDNLNVHYNGKHLHFWGDALWSIAIDPSNMELIAIQWGNLVFGNGDYLNIELDTNGCNLSVEKDSDEYQIIFSVETGLISSEYVVNVSESAFSNLIGWMKDQAKAYGE